MPAWVAVHQSPPPESGLKSGLGQQRLPGGRGFAGEASRARWQFAASVFAQVALAVELFVS